MESTSDADPGVFNQPMSPRTRKWIICTLVAALTYVVQLVIVGEYLSALLLAVLIPLAFITRVGYVYLACRGIMAGAFGLDLVFLGMVLYIIRGAALGVASTLDFLLALFNGTL